MTPEEFSASADIRGRTWFHELADNMSIVDGSAVVWLTSQGEFARPLLLPRQRRPEDGYLRR
jgi:hypothetical protein